MVAKLHSFFGNPFPAHPRARRCRIANFGRHRGRFLSSIRPGGVTEKHGFPKEVNQLFRQLRSDNPEKVLDIVHRSAKPRGTILTSTCR